MLRELEELTGPIPAMNSIDWNIFGFTVENQRVTGLGFFERNLKFLPESIGNLQNLVTLLLDNNRLESLPKNIGNLQNLKSLILRQNNLKTLPKTILKLQKLEILMLSKDNQNTFPENVKSMLDKLKQKGCGILY